MSTYVGPRSDGGGFSGPSVTPGGTYVGPRSDGGVLGGGVAVGEPPQKNLTHHDFLPNLWGNIEDTATGTLPMLARYVSPFAPYYIAKDVALGTYAAGKTFAPMFRAYGNLISGDTEDYRKFRRQYNQQFYEDPLIHILAPFALVRGGVGRIGATSQAARTAEAAGRGMTARELSRAAGLGWKPKGQTEYIPLRLGIDVPGAKAGTEIAGRKLPRSYFRSEQAKILDSLLKTTAPATTPLIGEYRRAARQLRRTGRVPYLGLMSLPAYYEYEQTWRSMTRPEKVGSRMSNLFPDPEDLDTYVAHMDSLDTPEARQTNRLLKNPAYRDKYENPTDKMRELNRLGHVLDQKRQEILIDSGAATPEGPFQRPGTTRLYRGAGEDFGGEALPDWMQASRGRWFSDSKDVASRYGDLHYIDVPDRLAEEIGTGAPNEYMLPENLLGDVRPYSERVREFDEAPYRHTLWARGAQRATDSWVYRQVRKTNAEIRRIERLQRQIVTEARRFGNKDLDEIIKTGREASNEMIAESRFRAGMHAGQQGVQTVDPALVAKREELMAQHQTADPVRKARIEAVVARIDEQITAAKGELRDKIPESVDLTDLSNQVDQAKYLVDRDRDLLDMAARGEMDTNTATENGLIPQGGTAVGRAVDDAIYEGLRKQEADEMKRLRSEEKDVKERRATSRYLDSLGLEIPRDIAMPTEEDLAEATALRAEVDRIKDRLKDRRRYRITKEMATRLEAKIRENNGKIARLERGAPIHRSPSYLRRRGESRYKQAEKILAKDIEAQQKRIDDLAEPMPVKMHPLEKQRVAVMSALESRYHHSAQRYERLLAAESALRSSAERSSRAAETARRSTVDLGHARERRITYLASESARMRDLIEHKDEIRALRAEIESSRGRFVGGGDPEFLRMELQSKNRMLPYYTPDIMVDENPRRFALAQGSISPQRPRADIFESRGLLMRRGLLNLGAEALGPAYFAAAKHSLNVSLHAQALQMAATIRKGEALPKGWEFLRTKTSETIGPIEQKAGEHMRAIRREYESEHDLTTKDGSAADIDFDGVDANGNPIKVRKIVPKQFADEFRAENRKADTFSRLFFERAMDVWRTLLLHLRVPWLVNNIVGNSFLYAVRFAGVGGLARVLRMYSQDTRTKGLIPRMRQLASYSLDEDQMAELFPEQIRGTRFETSATGETPEWVKRSARAVGVPSVVSTLDESELGRRGLKVIQGFPAVLPRADKRIERRLRRNATNRILRSSDQVQDAYAQIRKQGGSPSFKEAVDKAIADDPHFRDYVAQEVNQGLGDFLSLSKTERSWIRMTVPFYAWMREISRISGRLLVDHPMRLAILSQMAQAASEIQPDEVPSYMRGSVLLERMGWLGKGLEALPVPTAGIPPFRRFPQTETTPILSMHGANPYATVTDMARTLSAGTPFANTYQLQNLVGNLNPTIAALASAYNKPGGPSLGLPLDAATEFLRSLPQVAPIAPYPSYLYPDRTRGELLAKIFGDPRARFDPDEAAYQRELGR